MVHQEGTAQVSNSSPEKGARLKGAEDLKTSDVGKPTGLFQATSPAVFVKPEGEGTGVTHRHSI